MLQSQDKEQTASHDSGSTAVAAIIMLQMLWHGLSEACCCSVPDLHSPRHQVESVHYVGKAELCSLVHIPHTHACANLLLDPAGLQLQSRMQQQQQQQTGLLSKAKHACMPSHLDSCQPLLPC